MHVHDLDLIYANPLGSAADVADFRLEGQGAVTFPMNRLRLESTLDPSHGQAANVVFWCPQSLPDDIAIRWDFYPLHEPGLCILFFAAEGRAGQHVLDPALEPRTGIYSQYHHGDINALHVSYFRRRFPADRSFHTCNLRKSHGFHLVAQGADPIGSAHEATPPYAMELIKAGPHVQFNITHGEEKVTIFHWHDDAALSPILTTGCLGFRQMAPMIAEYANLRVCRVRVGD